MELKKFQQEVCSKIAERYQYFANHEERPYTKKSGGIPFFQSLSAITGSGKTPILAQTISQIRNSLSPAQKEPLVLWMTKSKVVIEQTYYNFIEGGKYSNLTGDFQVVSLKDFNSNTLLENKPIILTFTIASFNNKEQEDSKLNFYKINQDILGDKSIKDLICTREIDGVRRPLFIVYDEGHNLTQQQTELLMEFEPEGYLVSSATLNLPLEFKKKVINPYKEWADKLDKDNYDIANVNTNDVVQEQLIKKHIKFDGTTTTMEECISNLIEQWKFLQEQAQGLNIKPKVIYVCNTNILDGGETDDPNKSFSFREAPPIKIWKYLVDELKISPETIAIYTSELKVKDAPDNFNLFGGNENDYVQFSQGNFQHIIFNQSLQEGWDDPECYLAYVDKNIKSKISVSQIIGRVLRQPHTKHYEKEGLNTAHFYLRVDNEQGFLNIIDDVKNSLGNIQLPPTEVFFSEQKQKIIDLLPRKNVNIGKINIKFENVKELINKKIKKLTEIGESEGNGVVESFSKQINIENQEIKEIKINNNNLETRKVRLGWLIELRLREKSSHFKKFTQTSTLEFDKLISFGSRYDNAINQVATEVFSDLINGASLDYMEENEFLFEKMRANQKTLKIFTNSLYEGYSGLNKFELQFAEALDNTGYIWHRNVSQSGYKVPLLDNGDTQNFYMDFLVWKNDLIFSLDTKGHHLLTDSLRRKLFDIKEERVTKILTRFISKGKYRNREEEISKDGYTVWLFRNGQEKAIICNTMEEAVEKCLIE